MPVSGLESADLKLVRAAEHLNAIEACSTAYADRDPCKIVTDSNGKETLKITETPPPQIAIIAGEMVYQIRSALDHLAFDLVKLNPNISTIDPKWFEHCEFPLRTKIVRGCKLPLPQAQFSRALPGISIRAFTFIESVQPYYGRPFSNQIGILAGLSNIDKHRYLNLTVARFSHSELITDANLTTVVKCGLQNGAEIKPLISPDEIPSNVDLQRSFSAFVTFGEPSLGRAATLPVESVLKSCLDAVRNGILPTFEELLKNP